MLLIDGSDGNSLVRGVDGEGGSLAGEQKRHRKQERCVRAASPSMRKSYIRDAVIQNGPRTRTVTLDDPSQAVEGGAALRVI